MTLEFRYEQGVKIAELMLPMADGVRLYTRISMKEDMEKGPIIFTRNPYEIPHMGQPHVWEPLSEEGLFNKGGYIFIMQHVRGKGDSDGFCIPYADQERSDALYTLAWLRQQDFYDGEIYAHGGSYTSTVHLVYLDTEPHDIKGACLSIQSDVRYSRYYRNGMAVNGMNLDWWRFMMDHKYPNSVLEGSFTRPYKDTSLRAFGERVDAFDDVIMNDSLTDFWTKGLGSNALTHFNFPVLFTDGWYDWNVEGMFDMWEKLPPHVRERSCLRFGPWGHAFYVGNPPYPLPNANMPADWAVRWFDSIRTGKEDPLYPLGKVCWYSVGGEGYRSGEYPRYGTKQHRFYLGGGKLTAQPREKEEITYVYDPENCHADFKFGCMQKGHAPGEKEGVLSFLSEPFEAEKSYFGRLRWHMKVRTDCEDTAFFVRLYFVDKAGDAYNLTETVTALSHVSKNLQQGKTVTADLETPQIAFTVKPGMRLRVDLASDSTYWTPHANVLGHWAEVTETKIARNTVVCDEDAFIELTEE